MPNVNDTADPVTLSPSLVRPYRSHKIPACEFCRKRKSRCTLDLVDQPCLLCRMHGATCSRARANIIESSSPNTSTASLKRRRTGISRKKSKNNNRQQSRSPTAPASRQPSQHSLSVDHRPVANDASNQSSHIVGPAMARDAQVLERYMSPVYNRAVSYARPNPYSVYSHDPRNPVVYMKVPRQRNIAPSGNGTAGFKQFEAMEKIVEPLGPELCRLCVKLPSSVTLSLLTRRSGADNLP
jgi:hypothetical protein